jgi:hypothetical protein
MIQAVAETNAGIVWGGGAGPVRGGGARSPAQP